MIKMRILLLITLYVYLSVSGTAQYIIETPVTNLYRPVDFAFMPNGNVIVTHKESSVRIYTMSNNMVSIFWTFTDSLNYNFERGVEGVCLDPNFATNHYVYVYYVHSVPPNTSTNQRIRIVRFTENSNLGTAPFLVYDQPTPTSPVPPGNHFGGILRFKPSDVNRIYFVTGEIANSSNAQLLTNPYGKVLRINKDGTIPTDNPFYDDGNPNTGNDDRIWSYGLRNSFGFCFSPINDSLYETENGANTFDEVNFIRKGKNYGWPNCEGYCSPYNPNYKQPMHVWGSPLPALTGGLIYNSSVMPQFNNHFLVADNNYGRIYDCVLGNTPFYDTITARTQIFDVNPLTTLLQGTDGFIYAMNGGYQNAGLIYRIRPDNSGITNGQSPVTFVLHQNYPNPFNPGTTINYSLNRQADISIRVYDALGNEIQTLLKGTKDSGEYSIDWNASNYPSGVYFYKLTVNENTSNTASIQKKMVLLR